MGILRSDRVSGLGGANAINGSVKFGDSYLRIPYSTPDDFTFDGDFTIEYWYYPQSTGADSIHVEYSRPTGYKRAWQVHQDHSSNTYAPRFWWWAGGSTTGSMTSSITMTPNNWYHIAWVRIGTTLYNYVDGVSGGSSTGTSGITLGDPSDAEKPVNSLNIGVQIYNGPQLMLGGGHISNLRIIKGEGIYTAAFTPPTTRLEKTSNTVLLCCQSPGDVTKEETGKIIETNNIANSAPPQASTFAPDLGEDHGTIFADNTKFDTLSYMVPPGGTTTQSNRGRGLIIAGYTNPLNIKTTDYVQIQSLGNAIKFGDATALVRGQDAAGSSTRAVSAGGYVAPGIVDTIEYFTTATTSNAVDFGNLVSATSSLAGFGNETRGIWAGGYVPSASDKIDYVTIATTGNAADFGNCVANVATAAGCASPTRGVFGGGYASPAGNNTLQYVTIATTGNATDFGDLTAVTWGLHAFSSNTRGVFGGGVAPSITNTISYVTIASTGNAVDFGDLIQAAAYHACTSNGSRGIFAGGDPTSTFLNTIQYVTISTTGNSSDFGDMTTIGAYRAATSDSHGGLS